MNITFVNPYIFPYRKIMRDFDCAGETKGNYLYQPYDFLLMSGYVPSSWNFKFIDAVADELSEIDFFYSLQKTKPDIIVCSVAGINWRQDLETIKQIRTEYQNAYFFVFGDLFVDTEPRKEVISFVDGIFSSPVLFNFSIISQFKNRKEFNYSNYEGFHLVEESNLKSLKAPKKISVPLSRHREFVHKRYRWPFIKNFKYTTVFTSWGCPYSCSYCILNKFPNYWRDYKEIIEELVEVKKQGFKEIYIGDKSFGLPLSNTLLLLDELIKRNLNLSWSTYFHPNQYTAELLEKMAQAGCHTVVIGIETADLKDLQQYGRYVKKEQLHDLIQHANKLKIDICGDFIIGLPHDSYENIQKMIDYACRLNIQYASFNLATPLPGSSLRKIAIQKNIIGPNDQHFDSSGKNLIVSLAHLEPTDLLALRNSAIKRFYLRPSYLIKRLLSIRNLNHLLIQFQEGVEVIRSILQKGRA